MREKSLKKLILLHLGILLIAVIYYIQPFGCPILYFTGIPCPTCGVTRATVSLLKGDFSAYLSFNAMALPAILLVLFAFHGKFLVKNKRTRNIIIIMVSILILIFHIFRLVFY